MCPENCTSLWKLPISVRIKRGGVAHLFCLIKLRYSHYWSFYRWLEAMEKAVHPVHQVMLYLCEKYSIVYCAEDWETIDIFVHGPVQITTWKLQTFVQGSWVVNQLQSESHIHTLFCFSKYVLLPYGGMNQNVPSPDISSFKLIQKCNLKWD